MVDPVFIVLNMTVQHRCIRLQSDLMRQLCRIQPLIAVNLVVANDMSHPIGKNLRASARQRIHARGFQLLQRLAN